MKTVKIVTGSSANLMRLNTVAFDAAPLKITTAERELVGNQKLDPEELISEGKSFEAFCACIPEHQKNTGLQFTLESPNNVAANGRVSPAVAKIAGVLGIRTVGNASNVGTLEPTDKCRDEAALPGVTVKIGINLGLCSYYAEKGGPLVGFEKF